MRKYNIAHFGIFKDVTIVQINGIRVLFTDYYGDDHDLIGFWINRV